jgi:hypothetical protein
LIEAEVRERIAQEIEADRDEFIRVTDAHPDGTIARAYNAAARIARGGSA